MSEAKSVDTDVSASLSFACVLQRDDHLKGVSFGTAIPEVAAVLFWNRIDEVKKAERK